MLAKQFSGKNTAVSQLDTEIRVDYHWTGAEVAQVVEHGTENAGVASSTLALGT